MPKESTSLAGAFASSGKGLKETKEERRKREKAEARAANRRRGFR